MAIANDVDAEDPRIAPPSLSTRHFSADAFVAIHMPRTGLLNSVARRLSTNKHPLARNTKEHAGRLRHREPALKPSLSAP